MANTEPIDLKSIATLLNYERATTSPLFRHAKLREIANSKGEFQSVMTTQNIWGEYKNRRRTGFRFDTVDEPDNAPDLPDRSMLYPKTVLGANSLENLSDKDLERIYWQSRNYDSCFNCIEAFQSFADLFQPDTKLRIRTAQKIDYITSLSDRVILEFNFMHPKAVTASLVMPVNEVHVTGGESFMAHAVWGFSAPKEENVSVVLDMSSLQFGDVGRGLGGKGTFALETLDGWYDIIEQVTEGIQDDKTSARILHRDAKSKAWLKGIAETVKRRWENRKAQPWCAHCGKPDPPHTCSKCKQEKYCSREHQASQWPFHRHFCKSASDDK